MTSQIRLCQLKLTNSSSPAVMLAPLKEFNAKLADLPKVMVEEMPEEKADEVEKAIIVKFDSFNDLNVTDVDFLLKRELKVGFSKAELEHIFNENVKIKYRKKCLDDKLLKEAEKVLGEHKVEEMIASFGELNALSFKESTKELKSFILNVRA